MLRLIQGPADEKVSGLVLSECKISIITLHALPSPVQTTQTVSLKPLTSLDSAIKSIICPHFSPPPPPPPLTTDPLLVYVLPFLLTLNNACPNSSITFTLMCFPFSRHCHFPQFFHFFFPSPLLTQHLSLFPDSGETYCGKCVER